MRIVRGRSFETAVPLSDAGEVPEGRGGMIVTFDDNPDVMVISLAYLSKAKACALIQRAQWFQVIPWAPTRRTSPSSSSGIAVGIPSISSG